MVAALPLLQFESVAKTYPGVKALQEVSFAVHAGSVHALMGENGAGKSTLLKVLSGATTPTSGCLRLAGTEHVFPSTTAALLAGVAVIYQELHLIPTLTVAENIYLGHLPRRHGLVDRRKLRELTAAQLARLGEEAIDPDTIVSQLSLGQRQMVEIAKALSRGARVIAFDEPTSSLSQREIDRLFNVIGELRRDGCAILYVTHRMEELFRLCDACTVLRDGRHVRTYDSITGLLPGQIVKDMVGRDIADVFQHRPRTLGATRLQLDALTGPGLTAPASLSVARGEILGLFGLVGAGRTELLKLLFGATAHTGGTVRVDDAPISITRPADAIRAGVVYCTEDRKREGIIPVRSVQENCNLSARRLHLRLGCVLDEKWELANARQQVAALAVKTPSLDQLIVHLSGGNQQKVILARWLSEDIRVLLLDEPTRGIDIGARSEIYELILRLADTGVAVVMVSSDLPEVLGLSDRLLVMRQGALVAEFPRGATPEAVLHQALPVETSAPATA